MKRSNETRPSLNGIEIRLERIWKSPQKHIQTRGRTAPSPRPRTIQNAEIPASASPSKPVNAVFKEAKSDSSGHSLRSRTLVVRHCRVAVRPAYKRQEPHRTTSTFPWMPSGWRGTSWRLLLRMAIVDKTRGRHMHASPPAMRCQTVTEGVGEEQP